MKEIKSKEGFMDFEGEKDEKELEFSNSPDENENLLIYEKSLNHLFSIDNIMMKTDLKKTQVLKFAKAISFAKITDSKPLHELINDMFQLLISKDRKGRKEAVGITTAFLSMNQMNQVEDEVSLKRRLFGG